MAGSKRVKDMNKRRWKGNHQGGTEGVVNYCHWKGRKIYEEVKPRNKGDKSESHKRGSTKRNHKS